MGIGETARLLRTVRHIRPSQVSTTHRSPASDKDELIERLDDGDLCLLNSTQTVGKTRVEWRLVTRRADRLWTLTWQCLRWACGLTAATHNHGQVGQRGATLLNARCDRTPEVSSAFRTR